RQILHAELDVRFRMKETAPGALVSHAAGRRRLDVHETDLTRAALRLGVVVAFNGHYGIRQIDRNAIFAGKVGHQRLVLSDIRRGHRRHTISTTPAHFSLRGRSVPFRPLDLGLSGIDGSLIGSYRAALSRLSPRQTRS